MKTLTLSIKNTFKTFLAVSTLASVVTTYADDSEVFYSINVSKPNVMFVLDVSGSMSTLVPNTGKSRLKIMQETLRGVLEDAPDNLKVGLMNYGDGDIKIHNNERKRHHSVSGVSFPATDINALAAPVLSPYENIDNLPNPDANITVRNFLADVADSWSPSSYTPTPDALFEAATYFRGEPAHYGESAPHLTGAHPSTYTNGDNGPITKDVQNTARDSGIGKTAQYISPMQSSCQENYIVLMTDGAPTYRTEISIDSPYAQETKGPFALIRNTSKGPEGPLAQGIVNCVAAAGGQWQGECGQDITNYLATQDNSTEYEGIQTVKTFVVGFGSGLSNDAKLYLKSLETVDDDPETASIVEDGYFEAEDAETLKNSFAQILSKIAEPKGVMASPGYSVNVKSGLEHEKDIYIPVFDRKDSSRWGGNLKKFHIVDVDGRRLLRGQNELNAVNELGGFTSDAHDDWSQSPAADGADGKDVLKGGAASLIDEPAARKLYSNIDTGSALTAAANELSKDNVTNINNELLNITEIRPNKKVYLIDDSDNVPYRTQLINFIRGWKNGVDGTSNDPNLNASANAQKSKGFARKHMGDMLHSEPLVVTYPDGSDGSKNQYIFAATNEGYLHAFDTESGEEMFAFMPKELLKNIDHQFRNEGTAKDHKYGIDGAITYWFTDTNENRVMDSGEKAYIYFGLRRGGDSFYALEVTDINNPKFLWTTHESTDTTIAEMGQSWSTPYLAKVGMGSTEREVVIMTSGYDSIEDRDLIDQPGILDDATKDVETTKGTDVLILDALTGEKVFSLSERVAASSAIVDSIPGGVRILDTNYNGLIDRMYFADTGGNVWRLDLSEALSDTSITSKLTKFASLAGSGAKARKFYNEPDVAVMRLKGKNVFVVSIGSGYRAHPMDKEIEDKFFMLVDDYAYQEIDDDFTAIKTDDLAEIVISSSGGPASVTVTDSIKDSDRRGWEVTLPEEGEKVLATSIAFDGVVVFTTLIPEVLTQGDGIDQCAAPVVQGRLYGINVLTGKAGLDLDGDGEITDSDVRSPPISGGEITGKPQVVFNALTVEEIVGGGGVVTDTDCEHPVDIRIGKKLSQVTGYNACRLESVYWTDPVNND